MIGEASTSWSFVVRAFAERRAAWPPNFHVLYTLNSELSASSHAKCRERPAKTWSRSRMRRWPDAGGTGRSRHLRLFNENRHFRNVFLRREEPILTWDDGVEVMQILMTRLHERAARKRPWRSPPATRFILPELPGNLKP